MALPHLWENQSCVFSRRTRVEGSSERASERDRDRETEREREREEEVMALLLSARARLGLLKCYARFPSLLSSPLTSLSSPNTFTSSTRDLSSGESSSKYSTVKDEESVSSQATSSVGRSDQGSTSPRFYKRATAEPDSEDTLDQNSVAKWKGQWCVKLDGRKLKTPSLRVLQLPTADLAHAIALEWEYQSTNSIR